MGKAGKCGEVRLFSQFGVGKNDVNINTTLYVDTFEEEIDIKAVQEEIKAIEGELLEVRGKIDLYLQ